MHGVLLREWRLPSPPPAVLGRGAGGGVGGWGPSCGRSTRCRRRWTSAARRSWTPKGTRWTGNPADQAFGSLGTHDPGKLFLNDWRRLCHGLTDEESGKIPPKVHFDLFFEVLICVFVRSIFFIARGSWPFFLKVEYSHNFSKKYNFIHLTSLLLSWHFCPGCVVLVDSDLT